MTDIHRYATEPHIKMDHIDGPVLVTTDGQMIWLSLWDRFLLWIGGTDAHDLEIKYTY